MSQGVPIMMDRMLLRTALIALFATAVTFAQTTTATVSGVIRDATGAIVPGAKITASSTLTGGSRETTTDEEGRYSITNLGPGQYDIRAERAGFQTAVQSGVTLT